MSRRILLLGSSGMLGSALANAFTDFELIAPSHAALDITDRTAVQKFVRETKPDVIVNSAAYTAVDAAESDEARAFAVNRDAVGNLVEAANEVNALLIHFSTDYVFDGMNANGYDEAAANFAPVNVYGRSKLAGEEIIRNKTNRFALIRTSWLFGPGGKNFVDTMLDRVKTLHATSLNVVADQHGCPTYTPDLANTTRELIEANETGIFHLVNEGATTWADFAIEIFHQAVETRLIASLPRVHKIPSNEYPTTAKRPTYSILVNTRRPKLRSWKEALADYLKTKAVN